MFFVFSIIILQLYCNYLAIILQKYIKKMFSSLRCCIEVEVLLAGCAIYRPIDTLSVSMPTQIRTAAGAAAVVLEMSRA